MATIACVTNSISRRRLSLAAIDAAVSARLGPTRTLGNAQPACFNRQVAMYLARHLGGVEHDRHRPVLQRSRPLDRLLRHSTHRSIARE
jgi:hypothetical protein